MEKPEIRVVREPIALESLSPLAKAWHGTLIKGVADCTRGIIALGGDWHMDANTTLIADGSKQEDVWGFNIYPAERGDAALEYISLINIRPAQGNKTMELVNEVLRTKIRKIVSKLVPDLGL